MEVCEVTFEEAASAAWLHDLLKPHVKRVIVCDPRKNALLKKGNKNDRMDARMLGDLLGAEKLPGLDLGVGCPAGTWSPGPGC